MKRIVSLPVKGEPDYENDRIRTIKRYWEKKLERQHVLMKCNQKDEGKVY